MVADGGRGVVVRAHRGEQALHVGALFGELRLMLRFELLRIRRRTGSCSTFARCDGVEEQRRRDELVEDEDHRADEEDEELHRHFDHAVDEQAEAALGDRRAGEVALDLRLVGAEVRERQERAADQARPEVVLRLRIELEVDRVEASHPSGHAERFDERDVLRQRVDGDDQRDGHPAEGDQELMDLRPADRFRAAGRGVDHDQQSDHDVGDVNVPAEDHARR